MMPVGAKRDQHPGSCPTCSSPDVEFSNHVHYDGYRCNECGTLFTYNSTQTETTDEQADHH